MQKTESILQRFKQARKLDRENHLEKEKLKLGNLRVGNSGVMTKEGEVAGMCIRKAHLRQLGIEIESLSEDKYIMFELGYANEDEITKQLEVTLKENEIILREEQIPVEWYTQNGTRVTGRPDIVLCDKADWIVSAEEKAELYSNDAQIEEGSIIPGAIANRRLGLELKSVHSLWVARDVLFGGKPKLPHIIQAGHYMWKIGCKWKIVYKSYSQLGQGMAGNKWIVKQFPARGEPLSEYVEFGGKEDEPTIKHIKQFEVAYDLMIDDHSRILYKLEDSDIWNASIVTLKDIERFFEFASQMGSTGLLGPRPLTIDAHGNKLNYTDCSYCPIKGICDSADKQDSTYVEWLKLVQKHSEELG